MPINREIRPPLITRLKRSLPNMSVPNQCDKFGLSNRSESFILCGLYGRKSGAKIAASTIPVRTQRLTSTVFLLVMNRSKSAPCIARPPCQRNKCLKFLHGQDTPDHWNRKNYYSLPDVVKGEYQAESTDGFVSLRSLFTWATPYRSGLVSFENSVAAKQGMFRSLTVVRSESGPLLSLSPTLKLIVGCDDWRTRRRWVVPVMFSRLTFRKDLHIFSILAFIAVLAFHGPIQQRQSRKSHRAFSKYRGIWSRNVEFYRALWPGDSGMARRDSQGDREIAPHRVTQECIVL